MNKKLLLLALIPAAALPLIALLPTDAMSQSGGGACASGNCRATKFTATKGTAASVILNGDAGILFGDGTIQNTAASGFSGSATNFTATAAANAMAFQSNLGAEWCFDPLCKDRFQADGGIGGAENYGLYGRIRVPDGAANAGWVFDTYSPTDGTISTADLLRINNNGSQKFVIGAGGTATISSVTLTGGAVLASSLQASSNATMLVRGGPFSGSSAVANRSDSAQNLNTTGDKIQCFRHTSSGADDACIDKDGNYSSLSHLSCAMSASTTCTTTVPTGDVCLCGATSGAVSPVSCAVSSTTATCTASGSNSATWNIWVW